MFKKLGCGLLGLLALGAGATANAAAAAAVDVADVVTGLGNQATPMTSVLVASIGLAVLVVAFRWIRRALGG
jgi:hypothetical protein